MEALPLQAPFTLLLLLVAILPGILATGKCGGILEDISGEFEFVSGSNHGHESLNETGGTQPLTNCIWILRTPRGQNISFAVDNLSAGRSVILHYSKKNFKTTYDSFKLDRDDIGLPVVLTGDTVIVILTGLTSGSETEFSFSWTSHGFQKDDRVVSSVYYMNGDEGRLTVSRARWPRKLLWALNPPPDRPVELEVQANFEECDSEDRCECYYIALFEVLRNGRLQEFTRDCASVIKAQSGNLRHQVLLFGFVKATENNESADYLHLEWSSRAVSSLNVPGITSSNNMSPKVADTILTTPESESTRSSGNQSEVDAVFSEEIVTRGAVDGSGNDLQSGVVASECGGVVTLLAGSSTEIQYLTNGSSSHHHRLCAWGMRAGTGLLHTVQIYVDSQDFQHDSDGLTVYYEDSKMSMLKGYKVLRTDTGRNLTFYTRQALVVLASEGAARNASQGFRLLISSLQVGMAGNENMVSFVSPFGFYFYPEKPGEYYDGDDRLAVLIQPTSRRIPLSVTVSFLDAERNLDFLHIYSLLPYSTNASLVLHDRYTGYYPGGIENATTTSTHPRLLFFTSNGHGSGRGFQILWYQAGS